LYINENNNNKNNNIILKNIFSYFNNNLKNTFLHIDNSNIILNDWKQIKTKKSTLHKILINIKNIKKF